MQLEANVIYGTLKLPQLLAGEETEAERRQKLKRIHEEMKEMTRQKKEIEADQGEVRDIEILLNKEAFEEIGLI